jgi:hypothetical protein
MQGLAAFGSEASASRRRTPLRGEFFGKFRKSGGTFIDISNVIIIHCYELALQAKASAGVGFVLRRITRSFSAW